MIIKSSIPHGHLSNSLCVFLNPIFIEISGPPTIQQHKTLLGPNFVRTMDV
jgi:hypothetical protein